MSKSHRLQVRREWSSFSFIWVVRDAEGRQMHEPFLEDQQAEAVQWASEFAGVVGWTK